MSKWALVILGALAFSASGCAVGIGHPVVVDTYEPMYYGDYVVYYDEDGNPVYYVDDEVYYVPRTYVRYDFLVRHYHTHWRSYRTWHRHHYPSRVHVHHRRH